MCVFLSVCWCRQVCALVCTWRCLRMIISCEMRTILCFNCTCHAVVLCKCRFSILCQQYNLHTAQLAYFLDCSLLKFTVLAFNIFLFRALFFTLDFVRNPSLAREVVFLICLEILTSTTCVKIKIRDCRSAINNFRLGTGSWHARIICLSIVYLCDDWLSCVTAASVCFATSLSRR